MERYMKIWAVVVIAVLLIIPISSPVSSRAQQQEELKAPLDVWTPPPPRARGKGPYAPEPRGGHNIFKDEAEAWLADAIEEKDGVPPPLEDKNITEYVVSIGTLVARYSAAPTLNYKFIVTKNEDLNAGTVGDGRIYIPIGLLRLIESEDELAGVLAHEIAHNAFKHVPRTMTRKLFWMKGVRKLTTREQVYTAIDQLNLSYERNKWAVLVEKVSGISRLDELKADREAFYTTYRAGYNPRAILVLLKRIELERKSERGGAEVGDKFKRLVFGLHPLTSHREFNLNREAEFVNAPRKEVHYESAGFAAMKAALEKH